MIAAMRYSSLKRLLQQTRAIALVEFAISLPVVIGITVVGLETANYVLVHLRVSQIALTTADNAARVRIHIDESDINQLFEGDREIGSGVDFNKHGRVILSSLVPNAKGDGQTINWQRCFGDYDIDSLYGKTDKGKADKSLQYMGSADRRISAIAGTAVMFVEVSYEYQSMFPNSILDGTIVRYESAMNVRERTNQDISNNGKSSVANC